MPCGVACQIRSYQRNVQDVLHDHAETFKEKFFFRLPRLYTWKDVLYVSKLQTCTKTNLDKHRGKWTKLAMLKCHQCAWMSFTLHAHVNCSPISPKTCFAAYIFVEKTTFILFTVITSGSEPSSLCVFHPWLWTITFLFSNTLSHCVANNVRQVTAWYGTLVNSTYKFTDSINDKSCPWFGFNWSYILTCRYRRNRIRVFSSLCKSMRNIQHWPQMCEHAFQIRTNYFNRALTCAQTAAATPCCTATFIPLSKWNEYMYALNGDVWCNI